MVKTFTQEDVIRYSYNEMEATEKIAFEVALASEPELAEMLESIEESKANLDSALMQPDESVVNHILEYSNNTAPMEHTL